MEQAFKSWQTKWALHSAHTLRVRAQELGASGYVIKGLLPARSIGILLGDSGLGKSPLMYQAGLCVAAGLPFLGCETTKGRVLIADFENGIGDMCEMMERISGYLGLSGPPADLYLCLSGQVKTGHAWSLQNRPYEMARDVILIYPAFS